MSAPRFIRGHGLLVGGDPFTAAGRRKPYRWPPPATSNVGHGKCRCGALSPELPTTAARKRWHKQHKAEVLADREHCG